MKLHNLLWLVTVALFAAGSAGAAQFPIAELENCRDARECWLWCEIPAHKAACWAYQAYTAAGTVLGDTIDATTPSPSPVVKPVFPIADLGNCSGASACRSYCDVPANIPTCKAYAVASGLTRATTNFGQATSLLAHAKEELGCTSLEQCRAYCNEAANVDQCQALAAKYAPAAYRLAHATLFANARKILGCATNLECRTLCANPVNKDRCQAFAQEHTPIKFRAKLRPRAEGNNQAAPLPCTTLAECREYCQNPANAAACEVTSKNNKPTINLQQDSTYTCSTREECERYCQANLDKCPSYKASKDYQRVRLQQQLRGQAAPLGADQPANLERWQRSIIPPAPSSTPTN